MGGVLPTLRRRRGAEDFHLTRLRFPGCGGSQILRGWVADFSGGLGHGFCVCPVPKSPLGIGLFGVRPGASGGFACKREVRCVARRPWGEPPLRIRAPYIAGRRPAWQRRIRRAIRQTRLPAIAREKGPRNSCRDWE